MTFELPRWWWLGFVAGLVLLAAGGALSAVEQGLEDNYATDGCGFRYGPVPADERPAGCASQLVWIGVVDGASKATAWPGIAIAILAGVYVLGSAIAGAGRTGNGTPPGGDTP